MNNHPAIRACSPEEYTVFNRFSRGSTIVPDAARLQDFPPTRWFDMAFSGDSTIYA